MADLCSTCKIGANTVEDEPLGCPFIEKLHYGECECYVRVDLSIKDFNSALFC